MFQSLGRDSGCSSQPGADTVLGEAEVSIPRSGFWVFKLSKRAALLPGLNTFQSLGRDSGCSSANKSTGAGAAGRSFNPSVGILGVQARRA